MKKRINIVKKINNLILITFCITLCLSIGYSVHEANISIDGADVVFRVDKNVRITNFSLENTIENGEVVTSDYSVSELYTDIVLPNSNSSITYNVNLKNYGNVEMGISEIVLNSEYQEIFDIIVSPYLVGDKIRDNQGICENDVNGCKLNINSSFYLTIKYKDGSYNANNVVFNNVVIKFLFNEAYKVNFIGFSNINFNQKDYVALNNSTYTAYIGDVLENEELSIYMNEQLIYNYTYANGYLNIFDVNGSVNITKVQKEGTYYTIDYVNITNNNYPTTVKEGNKIVITFTDVIPTKITVVNSNDYTYENGVLTINNVTSNISIVATDEIDLPLIPEEGSNNVTVAVPSITPEAPIKVNDLLSASFNGQNYIDKVINQIDVLVTYTSTTGAAQSFNVELVVNNQTYTQTVNVPGKRTNEVVTLSFTGLTINKYDNFYVRNVADTVGNGIKNGNIDISNYEIIAYFAD